MSHKTDLQSNNVDLQAILNTINALPEAGGGGGSVETCTVTFTLSGIESDSIESEKNKIIAYTNWNSDIVSQTMSEFDIMGGVHYEISGSVTVKVGTLLYFAPFAMYTSGECIKLDDHSIIVNGDCDIMY